MKDADYYAENTGEFEDLTDAQKEAIFDGETIEPGDTLNTDEVNSENDTEINSEVNNEVSETPSTEPVKEQEPELLAKDGKHTIPYSELVDAREKAEHWENLSNQQKTLIEDLQAAKLQDEEQGGTENQEAILEEYEGDYPEIADEMKENLKPFIQKMIDDGVAAATKQFDEKVAPIQQNNEEAAKQKRYDDIVSEHPDAVEVYKSQELRDWIDSQPSFVKATYDAVLQSSTAGQMNELLSAYKSATSQVKDDSSSIQDKAKDIIVNTKQKAPASLTDIPAGPTGTLNESEAMLEMTPGQLEQKFAGKTPEQIEALMSKLV